MTQPENPPYPADAGPPSSVLRPRLAAGAPIADCPTLEDLGLVDAKTAAFQWQSTRSRHRWMETVWPIKNAKTGPWVTSIYGLLGSAGETVLVSIEAAAEIELAQRELATNDSLAYRAALARTIRFFGEGQINSLTVFGHNVANLTLRTLMLFDTFNPDGIFGIDKAKFTPKSRDKKAWVGLSPKVSKEMEKAIAASSLPAAAEATALVQLLRELTKGPWGDLQKHRNGQYHGWRGEADGVAGVNFDAPSVLERLQAGETVSVTTRPVPYVEGATTTDRTLLLARDTLDQVANWMPRYYDAWVDVVNAAKPD